MRNPNINKVTLKAVKTHRVEEKNIFALVFFFFFKDSLTLLVIYAMQKHSVFCHLLQGRELLDLCWLTQAEKMALPPSRPPFDLGLRASHLEVFSPSDSLHALTHAHKRPAHRLQELNCSHRDTISNRSFYTFARRSAWVKPTLLHSLSSTHKGAKQTADVEQDRSVVWCPFSPRQRLTHWPLGVHW